MVSSSPASRGIPPAQGLSDYILRFQNRNSEDLHSEVLASAQTEHERVRENAILAYRINEVRVASLRIEEQTKAEEERLQLEAQKAHDQIRLRELEEKANQIRLQQTENKARQTPSVPSPQHEAPLQKPSPALHVEHSRPAQAPQTEQPKVTQSPEATTNAPSTQPTLIASIGVPPVIQSEAPKPVPSSTVSTTLRFPPQTQQNSVQQSAQSLSTGIKPSSSVTTSPDNVHHYSNRYIEIHKFMKTLRSFVVGKDVPKTDHGRQLKKRAGEMRRSVKQSIGQLTSGRGANKEQIAKIKTILVESRDTFPSPPVDPANILASKPPPSNKDQNNGDTLPALFIYVLNILSKAIIAQFISEADVEPKKADPIGLAAVSVFAQKEFEWRGKSLIDILIAKFRVVCPVLFGIRGSEETKEGRIRIGWQRERDDNGNILDRWIPDQQHNGRMTGLGAGWASITLRNFTKSATIKNPFTPVNYWRSMASIISTPKEEMCSTQFIVLRAMTEHFEQKFIAFYGNAAKAALQVALVDFPARSGQSNAAVNSVRVLADKFERDYGLHLARR